ncbi:MAG: hypothetical protein ACX930_12985 [Erythrobacter sp.]
MTSTRTSAVLRKRAKPGFASHRPPRAAGEGSRIKASRALLAGLVFAPLALLSGAYSLAVVLDTRDPQISQSLYSELPKAKIRLGDLTIIEAVSDITDPGKQEGTEIHPPASVSELAAQMPAASRVRIEARALSGLADTAYSAGALRQLVFVEDDPVRRRALLDLARRVSRRDVSAAAQVAELQFRDGEAAAGLATLDQALAISDALDNRIFPLMLSAGQHPDFAPLLRARLARDPAWAERLARHAAATPSSAPLFASIVGAFPADSRARSVDYGAPLVDSLATNLDPDAAFAAYEAYSSSPQNPTAFGTQPLPPLDWRLVDTIDVGTRVLRARGPRSPVIEMFAQARRSGEVARIMLRLDPGTYALGIAVSDPHGNGGTVKLVRTCLEQGRETASAEVATALGAPRLILSFEVPAGCPFQSLRLSIEADREAVSVLVGDVRLQRTGARP